MLRKDWRKQQIESGCTLPKQSEDNPHNRDIGGNVGWNPTHHWFDLTVQSRMGIYRTNMSMNLTKTPNKRTYTWDVKKQTMNVSGKQWVQVRTSKSDRYLWQPSNIARPTPTQNCLAGAKPKSHLESYTDTCQLPWRSVRGNVCNWPRSTAPYGPPDSVRSPFAPHGPSDPKIRRDASKERQSLPWLNWKLRRLCQEGSPPKVSCFQQAWILNPFDADVTKMGS